MNAKKIFTVLTAMVLVLTMGLISGALAADPAPSPAQTVATTLQQTVFPVIGSFILGLLSVILTKLGAKWKLDMLAKQNNILIQVAAQGVAYAEEKAASLIGSKSELTGSEKLDGAIAYICNALPKVTPDQAKAAATAALAMIPGVGATGSTAVALNVPAATAPVALSLSAAPAPAASITASLSAPVPGTIPGVNDAVAAGLAAPADA